MEGVSIVGDIGAAEANNGGASDEAVGIVG